MSRMHRREFIKLGVGTLTAAVLSACGATPTATPVPTATKAPVPPTAVPAATKAPVPPTAVPAAPTTAAPATAAAPAATAVPVPPTATKPAASAAPADMAPKQLFKFAWEGGLGNGPIPGMDMEATINPFSFMSLMMLDGDAKVLPWLATSFSTSADGMVYTLLLDKRAKWSDDKPVTANDFKIWYDWISLPDQKSGRIGQVLAPVKGFTDVNTGKAQTIEGVKAIDDFTLQFTLSAPEGAFAQRLALPFSACGRLEQFKADPKFWLAAKASTAIVNGPFKMVHMEPEPAAIYKWETNPKWWGDKKPWITNIEGTTMRDQQTMSLAFENGDIDSTMFLSGAPRVNLRKKMPDVFVPRPNIAAYTVELNAAIEPLDDLNLRQALLRSIDWDKMAAAAWEGDVVTSQSGYMIAPGLPCRDTTSKPFPFDVVKAKEYLSKSKYGPTGDKVPKIRWSTAGSDPGRIRATQIIQEFWRVNLGIENVEVKNAESEFGADSTKIAILNRSAGAAIPNPAFFMSNLGVFLKDPGWDKMATDLAKMLPTDPTYCATFSKDMAYLDGLAVRFATGYVSYDYCFQKWVKGGVKMSGIGVLYTLMDIYIAKH